MVYLFVLCAFASVLILFSSLCVTLPQMVWLLNEHHVSPPGKPPEAPEHGDEVDEAMATELREQQLAEWTERTAHRIRRETVQEKFITGMVTDELVRKFKARLDGMTNVLGKTEIDDDNHIDHLGFRYFDFNILWMKVRTQHSNHVALPIIAINCFSQFLLWSSDGWKFRWQHS